MLFSEISPLTYRISVQKEVLKRHLQNLRDHEIYSTTRTTQKLPNVVSNHESYMIKKGKDIDPVLQHNKADNIQLVCQKLNGITLAPGEVFSFWKLVGKVSKKNGFKDGRVIMGKNLTSGLGGGLCNLANTIHLMILHSPLEVTEFHSHSDALAPDKGKRVPFSAGTSVSYNYVDYKFKNNTDQKVQLCLWCENETLYAELRSEKPFLHDYAIVEEGHHFHQEGEKFYRISKIYQQTLDKKTGEVLEKKLVLDNHSEVMFDYQLIPKELIY